MKNIYLIRHGQASAGTADYDRLSQRGERQAAVVGQHLAAQGLMPGAIWSGSLKRQRQTATIAHKQHEDIPELRLHEGLNEYDHTSIHERYHPDNSAGANNDDEDMPANMDFSVYEEIINSWIGDDTACADPAVESWIQFQQRTMTAVIEATQQSDAARIALYSSGGVIAAIVGQLQALDDNLMAELIWKMSNASITRVDYQDDQLSLVSTNQIAHFETLGDKSLITWI